MVKAKQQRRRDRRKLDSANPPLIPMTAVVSVTASGASQVTIVFAGVVQISGDNLPATWKFGTANHTLAALVSSTGISYVFTTSGTVAAAQVFSMPGSDPAARTPLGGYVSSDSGVLS